MQFYHFMDTKWLLFIWQNFTQGIYLKSWYCWSKTNTLTDVDCLGSFLGWFCLEKSFNACILAPKKGMWKKSLKGQILECKRNDFLIMSSWSALVERWSKFYFQLTGKKSNNNSTISTVGFFPLFNLLKSKQKYSKYL